jgi:S1-C subfamily serine protease
MKTSFRFISTFIFVLFASISAFAAPEQQPQTSDINIPNEIGEELKKISVTIKSSPSIIAYGHVSEGFGSGFIADAKNGFIVTNAHVAGMGSAKEYTVTLHNGALIEAKLVYLDPMVDCAILSVDPKLLPTNLPNIPISTETAKVGGDVIVISNSENIGFSLHRGHIADSYQIDGLMPQGSYNININIKGGCSGSATCLLTKNKCTIIGLNYGGGESYILSLKIAYVQYILDAIKQGKIPNRKHCGIITTSYNLDYAIKHKNFPSNVLTSYLKDFQDRKNKVLLVEKVIKGTPAYGVLQAGDIIWSANGQVVAGDLFILDMVMNNSTSNHIEAEIYRLGEKLKLKVPIFDLNETKLTRMLQFGGVTFFASDMLYSARTGIPLKSIVVAKIQPGAGFILTSPLFTVNDHFAGYRLRIKKIDNHAINSFEDLTSAIKLVWKQKKKFIHITYKNYQFYEPSFNGNIFSSAHEEFNNDVVLNSTIERPRIIHFDNKEKTWQIDYISD